MEDQQILDLYFQRSEQAIAETDAKYGNYCYRIAYQILRNSEDSEESVSDAYLAAWNTIPPHRPSVLATFLGKIVRNISIDRWRKCSAGKRGGGELPLCLEELGCCVSGTSEPEQAQIAKETVALLNRFLSALPETERILFVRRYWYLDSTAALADAFGFSQTKVTTLLSRIRKKLRRKLEKEGLL